MFKKNLNRCEFAWVTKTVTKTTIKMVAGTAMAATLLSSKSEASPQCAVLFDTISISIEKPNFRAAIYKTEAARETETRLSVDSATRQERQEGFVKVRGGRDLYVDFLKPAPGKPIIVLSNGLTYRTAIWDSFVKQLKGHGIGILRYDPVGMGETMKRYGPPQEGVQLSEQARDLNSLLISLDIKNPIHLVGLSYGGAVSTVFAAMYPNRIASLILMAPFTAALESQDKQIRTQIALNRAMFPFNPATNDELYDYFLRQIVFTTYGLSEPIVYEHPYKLESVFRMVQGGRKFVAEDYVDQ